MTGIENDHIKWSWSKYKLDEQGTEIAPSEGKYKGKFDHLSDSNNWSLN